MEPDIAHDCSCHQISRKLSAILHHLCADADKLITIDDPAFFIYCDQAICIAIVGHTKECSLSYHFFLQFLRVGRTTGVIDVDTIRFIADHRDVCAQLGVYLFCDPVSGSIGTVQHQLAPFDIHIQRTLQKISVPVQGIIIRLQTASQFISRDMAVDIDIPEDDIFDLILDLIIQLESISVEEFDPVILKRIVGRRDHNTCVGLIGAYQVCDRRSRQNADLDHIAAYRQDPCAEGVFQHISRKACVLSDQNDRSRLVFTQYMCSRFSQLKRQLRRQFCICNASDTIGTE